MKQLPDDYTVRLVDMPTSVGGRISECPDGHIDVYLNARHSHDGQLRAADHEFDHWRNDDLHNGLDIRVIEGRDGRPLPPLMRARDLMPKSTAVPVSEHPHTEPKKLVSNPTSRQIRVMMNAIHDLDDVYYEMPFFDL